MARQAAAAMAMKEDLSIFENVGWLARELRVGRLFGC